ncbi:bile acid:sodium symporter family protein [Pararhodospirillum photometricum]|nr:bile acid:sodium symporter family protein [Pararhodospirillum photometricum]
MIAQLLPLGLAFIMFSIGLGLTLQDFTRVFRLPVPLGVGLLNQMVVLPLLAVGLVALYDGRPDFALGLILIAACPGGISSNLLTMLAGGSAALSISMTAITSMASLLTLPLIVGVAQSVVLGQSHEVTMPLGQVLGSVFGVSGVPMALGMLLRHRGPALAARLRPWCHRLSTGIFVVIVISAFVGLRQGMMDHVAEIGPLVLALNLGTMTLGLLTAGALRLGRADGIAITLECGLQNAALAIFIATSVLGRPDMVVPAILYALVMNLTALPFVALMRRRTVLSETLP